MIRQERERPNSDTFAVEAAWPSCFIREERKVHERETERAKAAF